jgi:hypothetical protein
MGTVGEHKMLHFSPCISLPYRQKSRRSFRKKPWLGSIAGGSLAVSRSLRRDTSPYGEMRTLSVMPVLYNSFGLYGNVWATRPAGYEVMNHAVDTRRLL